MQQLVMFGRLARPGVAALYHGAVALGWRAVVQRPQFETRAGLIANVGAVFADGLGGNNADIVAAYRAAGVRVFVLDLPRLRHAVDSWGLFENTLHDLPARIGNEALVSGVIPDRVPAFVLVVGQKPDDAAHHMNALQCAQWARETVAVAKSQYGYPVKYRPHPKDTWNNPAEPYGADEISDPRASIREEFAECAGVITHNSTAGVEAIDAGVPVLITAPEAQCFYAQYAAPLGNLFPLLTPEQRVTCLLRVAATQWTPAQLQDGTALRCVLQGDAWPAPTVTTVDAVADADAGAGLNPETFVSMAEAEAIASSVIKSRATTPRKRHGH